MKQIIFIFLFLLLSPAFCFGLECKTIEYPDHTVVDCVDKPVKVVPPQPKPITAKKPLDSKSAERKAAVKALTKLLSQSGIGLSYKDLANLLGDVKTEVSIYENATKNFSHEDSILVSIMNAAISSYQSTLMDWRRQIDSRYRNDYIISTYLSESSDYANKAISYYNENWQ